MRNAAHRYHATAFPAFVLALVLCAGPTRAADTPPAQPTPEQVQFFELKVRPVLATHCYKCHGPEKQKAHLRLDTIGTILAGGESGAAVVPGKPQESLLINAVNYQGRLEMPPDNRLGKDDVAALTEWVKMGAPWPAGAGKSEPVMTKREAVGVTEQDRQFWSFQPVRRPELPQVSRTERVANPIDNFIVAKLEAKGLEPNPPAGRRELIRRATFDLTGLPPMPEEVEAFEKDESPDAYERLLDRLLASPHYGERWGRHWLDLVRFAQTNGYEFDGEKPLAWRYRDYVIRALNEDKPYDRFVKEQLAGDELDDVTRDSVTATGFYRLGVWDIEPDDKAAAICEEMDDILRTTTDTFLGLTVGCARCHDHKFDPVPQEDYYRLMAFFAGVAPYGTGEGTHFQPNDDAIFTPLTDPARVAAWREQAAAARGPIKTTQGKISDLIDQIKDGQPVEKVQEVERLKADLRRLEDAVERPAGFDVALSVRETAGPPPATHVLIRGDPRNKAREVQPGVLSVLDGVAPMPTPSQGVPSAGAATSGRRRQLAEWVASPANPLTARVMVNRLWHYHFGRGIVASPSDFGHTGVPPSHPELLDWLASELTDGGWRLKRLHKLIMLSATYRQSSRATGEPARAADPDNVLLWRQNLRRLEAEAIRDAILAVSGQLNPATGGRGVFPTLSPEVLSTQSRPGLGWDTSTPEEQNRRSVYIFVKRTLGVPMMEAFDLPTPDKPGPARSVTTIAPQALILLNSEFIDRQADALAERVAREAGEDQGAQIERLFRLALCRAPSDGESRIAAEFLGRRVGEPNPAATTNETANRRQAMAALCRLVLNLNEFVYVD